jgi:hypothetical protein
VAHGAQPACTAALDRQKAGGAGVLVGRRSGFGKNAAQVNGGLPTAGASRPNEAPRDPLLNPLQQAFWHFFLPT